MMLKIAGRFLKCIVLICSSSIALILVSLIIMGHFLLPYIPMVAPNPLVTGYIGFYGGILSLFLIPLILIVRGSIHWAWGHKNNLKMRRILIGTWLVCFMAFMATTLFSLKNYSYSAEKKTILYKNMSINDSPLLISIPSAPKSLKRGAVNLDFGTLNFHKNNLQVNQSISVTLEPSDNKEISVKCIDKSQGRTKKNALQNIEFIKHEISMKENEISIDDYLTIYKNNNFRNQSRSIVLSIPLNRKIKITGNIKLLDNKELALHDWDKENTLIMSASGLEVLSKLH